MSRRARAGSDRSFGLSVGGMLCLIAAVLVWRGSLTSAQILGALGVTLVAFGLTFPRALSWPRVAWWRLAHALGYVNGRFILTVLFAVLIVPLNVFWRVTGKDPLARRRAHGPGWSPYPTRYRDRKHYARMY